MIHAKCRGMVPSRSRGTGTDVFFPEKGQSPNPGKVICFTCPVRLQCLEYRDEVGANDGIWGGVIIKNGVKKNDAT